MDVESFKSTDGGHLFNKVKIPHGDNHGLWIDPRDTRRMIASNDGGVTVTRRWRQELDARDNQPTAQFYHVITDNRCPIGFTARSRTVGTGGITSRSDDRRDRQLRLV